MIARFRPRFTVRTLAVLITLICAYFEVWESTEKYGLASGERSPMPLIVISTVLIGGGSCVECREELLYLWLCGPKIAIPIDDVVEAIGDLSEFFDE